MAGSGISRRFQRIARLRKITSVLAKYGFTQLISGVDLPFYLRGFLRMGKSRGWGSPDDLKKALEELGPIFVKFGQMLSTRSYLLPPGYASALAELQDRVSPFPAEVARGVIEAELGRPLDEVFIEFEEMPFASASIAQVHRATTIDGRKVCVKIQRPGIEELLELDISILKQIALLLERYVNQSRRFDPTGIVAEFERTIRREIDFTVEATNIEIFRRNFSTWNQVFVPCVYIDLSTPKVLVTEYVEGIKISDLDAIRRAQIDSSAIARAGARMVFKQVLEDGFFHADPHPGNLFVLSDGRIAMVDFGIVGRLTRREMELFEDFAIAALKGDGDRMFEALSGLGFIPAGVDRRMLIEDMMVLFDFYKTRSLGQIDFRRAFRDFIWFVRRHGIRMRSEFLLLGKALSTYEEVGRALDPDFNVLEEARHLLRELGLRRRSLSRLMRLEVLNDLISSLLSIPTDLAKIVSDARDGRLKIEFEHIGLEKLTGEMERSSNRLSFALLVAALIVASSLILVRSDGYTRYHLLGVGGFLLAAVVGAWLLINIVRSGRV